MNFFQIGANDGVLSKNDFIQEHAFNKRHWYGIILEPSPIAYNKLLDIGKNKDRIKALNGVFNIDNNKNNKAITKETPFYLMNITN